MKIGIHFHARYEYEEPASFSPHLVRLFPRNSHNVRVERTAFATDGGADIQYRHDLFDNEVARCFYPQKESRLDFDLELDLELIEKNPFHFLLDSHALRLPFDYLPHEAAVLAPFLGSNPSLALPPELAPPSTPLPTVEAIVNLNHWIFENLGYERRDEGEAMPPAETLAAGRGALPPGSRASRSFCRAGRMPCCIRPPKKALSSAERSSGVSRANAARSCSLCSLNLIRSR